MHIAYDTQTFSRQKTGGVSRLFADLIYTFDQTPELGVTPTIKTGLTHNLYALAKLGAHGFHEAPKFLPRHVLYAKHSISHSWHQPSADVIHHTYYDKRFLSRGDGIKRIVTVYDMIPELFRSSLSKTVSHLDKREFVAAADAIICISESTRNDLVNTYGEPLAPISVIPLAVDPRFAPDLPRLSPLPTEYLLYVGGRDHYKNFTTLLRALAELQTSGLGLPLVVVGKPQRRSEKTLIGSLGLSGLIHFPTVRDSDLPYIYSNARALIQTSRYEGFGLPILEAMASGTPAIAVNAAAMPEVGGDVVQYFEAGNSEDLAHTIETVITDNNFARSLADRGVERSAAFSLYRMAASTAVVYRSLA